MTELKFVLLLLLHAIKKPILKNDGAKIFITFMSFPGVGQTLFQLVRAIIGKRAIDIARNHYSGFVKKLSAFNR